MINTNWSTEQRINNFLNTRLKRFDVNVGVRTDGPSAYAKNGVRAGQLAGGPRNRQRGPNKAVTVRAIMEMFNERYNLLLAPWRAAANKDVTRVVEEIARSLRTPGDMRRFLNAAQAVVRNPIARGDYGENSERWAKIKGFNRLLINTGKFFTSIKAWLVH